LVSPFPYFYSSLLKLVAICQSCAASGARRSPARTSPAPRPQLLIFLPPGSGWISDGRGLHITNTNEPRCHRVFSSSPCLNNGVQSTTKSDRRTKSDKQTGSSPVVRSGKTGNRSVCHASLSIRPEDRRMATIPRVRSRSNRAMMRNRTRNGIKVAEKERGKAEPRITKGSTLLADCTGSANRGLASQSADSLRRSRPNGNTTWMASGVSSSRGQHMRLEDRLPSPRPIDQSEK
jgi:hypothetical protein